MSRRASGTRSWEHCQSGDPGGADSDEYFASLGRWLGTRSRNGAMRDRHRRVDGWLSWEDLHEEAPNRTRHGNALLVPYFAAMISSSTRNSGLNSCGIMRSMEAGRSSPRNRVRTFP